MSAPAEQGTDSHTDPNPKLNMIYFIVGLLIVSMLIWAFKGFFSDTENGTSLITVQTVNVSKLLGNKESATVKITEPTYFDFTKYKVSLCSHGRLHITTENGGEAILNGIKFENNIATSKFDNTNVWLIEPLDNNSSITITKKI